MKQVPNTHLGAGVRRLEVARLRGRRAAFDRGHVAADGRVDAQDRIVLTMAASWQTASAGSVNGLPSRVTASGLGDV